MTTGGSSAAGARAEADDVERAAIPEVVVVDEAERTAYVFETEAEADAWSTTGAPTWVEQRDATDAELAAALGQPR